MTYSRTISFHIIMRCIYSRQYTQKHCTRINLVVLVTCRNLPNMLSYYIVTCLHIFTLVYCCKQLNIYNMLNSTFITVFSLLDKAFYTSLLCLSLTDSHHLYAYGDRAATEGAGLAIVSNVRFVLLKHTSTSGHKAPEPSTLR